MKTINLKDYYAHIGLDTYIDIPDEVFSIFEEYRKAEQAYQSRISEYLFEWVLRFGDNAELFEPVELRTEIKTRLEVSLKKYLEN